MKVNYLQAYKIFNKHTIDKYRNIIITGTQYFEIDKIIKRIKILNNFKKSAIIKKNIINNDIEWLKNVSSTLNLFKEKRLIQIVFNEYPDDEITQQTLKKIFKDNKKNDFYIFIFNNFSKKQENITWFKEITSNNLHIATLPLNKEIVCELIKLKIEKNNKITITNSAILMIASTIKGNLSEAYQIISILSNSGLYNFNSKNIMYFLEGFKRYNVIDLIENINYQNTNESIIIFNYLVNNSTEYSIILRAILKEIKLWFKLVENKNKYQPISYSKYTKSNIHIYNKILFNIKMKHFKQIMKSCLIIDFIIKGIIKENIKIKFISLLIKLTNIV